MPRVYLNGSLVDERDALVSAFDHGIVVGDGVFETILVHKGRPFATSRHLARLDRSAIGLGLHGLDIDEVRRAINLVADEAGLERGRLRVTVTSGSGPLGSARGENPLTLIVAIAPAELDDAPCRVDVAPWPRNERGPLSGLKTISYAENARALAVAHDAGASEAIFFNLVDNLCEGTGSNVFFVLDGVLCTPPLSAGCLPGTTRDLLLEQMDVIEIDLPISRFTPEVIDEAFLASSVRGVQPIEAIGTQAFSSAPGPVTALAVECFSELLDTQVDP